MAYRSPTAILLLSAIPDAASPSDSDIAILDGSQAPALLKQCSRPAPPPGETTWMPTRDDVARLEQLLPGALAASGNDRAPDGAQILLDRSRQYVGIVRDGRRFLYGSFIPADAADHRSDWRKTPLIVCDGGPSIFGVEMDVEKGRITRIDFNGRG